MTRLGSSLLAALGVCALFATASLANDPAPAPAAAKAKPHAAPGSGAPPSADPATADPAAASGAAPRPMRSHAMPHVFRKVGTGEVITPAPGDATKKWKDCTYNEKGAVTNAPCTGVKKDDKGVTWWP